MWAIITSVVNVGDAPLKYFHVRSMYSAQERFYQTLDTIRSIRERLPQAKILLAEGSCMDPHMELELRQKVDLFVQHPSTHVITYTEHKAHGEAMLLLHSLDELQRLQISPSLVFKISGRYTLNESFCETMWTEKDLVTCKRPVDLEFGLQHPQMYTFFYSVPALCIGQWRSSLRAVKNSTLPIEVSLAKGLHDATYIDGFVGIDCPFASHEFVEKH